MKPSNFDMVRPSSLKEALAILAEHPDSAKVIAGGQSLVPVMNLRLATPELLIDLNKVVELAGIRYDGTHLRIGAMTRQCELLRDPLVAQHAPLLVQAMRHVGHVQTRSRGTVGGSLAHADPAAELPVVMVALDATITVASNATLRTVPARGFFQDAMTTVLASDELITEIAIPTTPSDARSRFREYARRHGDFAIVAVAIQYSTTNLAVAVGGLEAAPRHLPKLAEGIRRVGSDRDQIAYLISAELQEAVPLNDLQASAEFRRHLAEILLRDCINEVLAP